MKIITVDMVRSWEPCYDPTEIVPEDWEGTALDVLNLPIPAEDKLWVVLCEEVISFDVLREFSHWCALEVAHLCATPDIVMQYLNTGDEKLRVAAIDAATAIFSVYFIASAARNAILAAIMVSPIIAARAARRTSVTNGDAQVEKLKEMLTRHTE